MTIGLGNMGYFMAGHLRKKMSPSATLYVNDISPLSTERFIKEYSSFGPIVVAPSAKETAANSSIFISVVPKADNVRQVYLDNKTGVICAPKNSSRLLLECSTIDLATTHETRLKTTEAGAGIYLDTPISVRDFKTSVPRN